MLHTLCSSRKHFLSAVATVADLLHYGEPVTVSAGNPVRRPIPPCRPLTPPPQQPHGRAPVRRTVGGTDA